MNPPQDSVGIPSNLWAMCLTDGPVAVLLPQELIHPKHIPNNACGKTVMLCLDCVHSHIVQHMSFHSTDWVAIVALVFCSHCRHPVLTFSLSTRKSSANHHYFHSPGCCLDAKGRINSFCPQAQWLQSLDVGPRARHPFLELPLVDGHAGVNAAWPDPCHPHHQRS